VTVSTGAQHTRDEEDAAEKVVDGKVSVVTEDDHARVHQATGADTETETTEAHSEAAEMNAEAATTFRNKTFRAATEDAQPHPAVNTAAGTLDYSELLGIMKQMQERTTAQVTLAHKQNEKLENKHSELTTTLDEVTHDSSNYSTSQTATRCEKYALIATRRI